MKKHKAQNMVKVASVNSLFDRVVSILEQARANTVRAVNNNMTLAYWLIGREIVQELQQGEERAELGRHAKRLSEMSDLSIRERKRWKSV